MYSSNGGQTMPKESVPFDPKSLVSIVGSRTSKEYRKKEIVFAQGAPADEVFYISKGRIKISVVSKQGKEARFVGIATVNRGPSKLGFRSVFPLFCRLRAFGHRDRARSWAYSREAERTDRNQASLSLANSG
jgi:Cyclic nucleotide-binding domain